MSVLRIRQLCFSYGRRRVLDGVDFDVHGGELLGVVGPNGAGKTTLLRLILGLLYPQSGEVLLDESPVHRLRRDEVARHIALVPQEVRQQFAFSVRDIVAMGRTPYLGRLRPAADEDRMAVDEALRAAEITEQAARAVTELSGGERQRVWLARAFAQTTPILVLDEPTANLDLFHELRLFEQVRRKVDSGCAVIAAMHQIDLAARFCDRMLVLKAGHVAALGKPSDVLSAELLADVFRVEARVELDPASGRPLIDLAGTRRDGPG